MIIIFIIALVLAIIGGIIVGHNEMSAVAGIGFVIIIMLFVASLFLALSII